MNDVLAELGLQEKEINLYKLLLKKDLLTAAEIAKELEESRTNTYMLLDDLVAIGLVIEDEIQPVKRFGAADPKVIDGLLATKQRAIAAQRQGFQLELDDLRSQYRLARNQPGVVSGEGLASFDASLQACMQAKTPILIFGSDDAPQNPEAYGLLKKRLYERKRQGVETKILFHIDNGREGVAAKFKNRGHEARFIGDKPFTGEVVIYDYTVLFTTYMPVLVNTTITDPRLADTMRTVFSLLWKNAEV